MTYQHFVVDAQQYMDLVHLFVAIEEGSSCGGQDFWRYNLYLEEAVDDLKTIDLYLGYDGEVSAHHGSGVDP